MIYINYVQTHRRHKRITQEELAKKLGIPWKELHKIETGKVFPNIEMREKIAKELNMDIQVLFP